MYHHREEQDRHFYEGVLLFAQLLRAKEEKKRRQAEEEERRRRRRKKKLWIRPWLARRVTQGYFENLISELHAEDPKGYRNFLRTPPDIFKELVDRLDGHLRKQDTFMRKALPPALKVALTLRYLATGETYHSLHYAFRVSISSICTFIPIVCEAIIEEFSAEYMTCPSTAEEWTEVADLFGARWNFHNTIGAIDGKHIGLRRPPNAGSLYYNYKGFHSIVLMGVVDASYKFLYVDCGANGSVSDGGVFKGTEMAMALDNNTAGVPAPRSLPGEDEPLPFFLVGDDAFAMRTWLLKPYPHRNMSYHERIFNYRLSRARRVSENAFGILVSRFRFLLATMPQLPETATGIVIAACLLHNLLITRCGTATGVTDREETETHTVVPGNWRRERFTPPPNLQAMRRNTTNREAKILRDYLKNYYNSENGRVPWQDNMV